MWRAHSLAWFIFALTACHDERPLSAPQTPEAKPSASTAATAAPLLVYHEDDATLSFWSTGAVRLALATPTAARTCDTQLGDNGNLWTPADVNAAFRHADVQTALKTSALYRSAYPSRALLEAGASTITWVNAWKELPPSEPEAVRHLHEVLHGLTANRRSLCP
ncbi:MAG: hypothetical protein IPJ34_19805 [Myxococcales bacterium]|nr:hypothetical protein [Myxococcales bacterium]